MKTAVATPETIVCRHLDAVWAADWKAMTASAATQGTFSLRSGTQEHVHSVGELYNFYRHLTQAWDFYPGHIRVGATGDGDVSVEMELTNGGDWTKMVAGRYSVSGGVIDRIDVTDSVAERTANG